MSATPSYSVWDIDQLSTLACITEKLALSDCTQREAICVAKACPTYAACPSGSSSGSGVTAASNLAGATGLAI